MNCKEEKAITIRQPATSNLMIDSFDRDSLLTSPWTFTITKNQSILNGFFTRVGTTEVVLEWYVENVSAQLNNNQFTVDNAGIATTVTIPDGIYTIEQLLDLIVGLLNVALGAGTFEVDQTPTGAQISRVDNTPFTPLPSSANDNLPLQLGYSPLIGLAVTEIPILETVANIQTIRYIDFVSSQLTYNQDLKDSSTQKQQTDVLCRWYMAYDNYTATDGYGFPILMGYTPFTIRRTFSPPKQIRWDSAQPIGNLAFQCYGATYDGDYVNLNTYLPISGRTNWLMTLQISEN
jgi:hypothetical protein